MKKIILSITLVFIFMNINIQPVVSAETINSDLNEMVDVRIFSDEENNRAAANEMLERLSKIDDRILKNVSNSGALLILSDAKLVDLPEFGDLKGVVPRGHTEPWDNIPGLGGFIAYVAIGKSDPSLQNNHGDINLELHEFGHMVDMFAMPGVELSNTDAFIQAHAEEKNNLFPNDSYFDYRDEYFGEVFAYYYLSNETRQELFDSAPLTAEYLASLHYKLLTVTDVSQGGFNLEWDPVEGASYYTVLLNGESYDQEEPNMEATDLMGNYIYTTQVLAKDENDEILEESFSMDITTYPYDSVDQTKLGDAYNRASQVDGEKWTDHLSELYQKAEEMFGNIELGFISQDKVDALAKEIEEEVDKIEDTSAAEEKEEDQETASGDSSEKNDEENTSAAKTEDDKDISDEKNEDAATEAEAEKVAEMPTSNDKNTVLPKMVWVVGLGVLLALILIIWLRKRRKVNHKK